MDRSIIERIISTWNSEKAGGLLKGINADAGDLFQFFTIVESAPSFTVFGNVVRRAAGQTGNIGQQGFGSCIQINANLVDAVFHDIMQGFV